MARARPARGAGVDHRGQDVVALRATIQANLRAFERARSTKSLLAAAVAAVVIEDAGRPCVPIFQRPSGMRRHAGQMALPGGRLHEGEAVEQCAIRELREELGLEVGEDDVLGLLDDFDTESGFTITPVVMWSGADAGGLRPSGDEVAELFLVPLRDLRSAVAAARPGPSDSFSLMLPAVEVFAPTAAILYQFSEVALDGRAVRVADFFQPPWTHR
jgi:8-oxo-dGTP pyrophosphatase MutT (NUDIX family)